MLNSHGFSFTMKCKVGKFMGCCYGKTVIVSSKLTDWKSYIYGFSFPYQVLVIMPSISLSRLDGISGLLVWVWNYRNDWKALILDFIMYVVSNIRTCQCRKKKATQRVWSGCGIPL